MYLLTHSLKAPYIPWNKGKLIGQKAPLKLKDIWAIRIHLQMASRTRDLALFNLAIDSKLRGGDLVNLILLITFRIIKRQRESYKHCQI